MFQSWNSRLDTSPHEMTRPSWWRLSSIVPARYHTTSWSGETAAQSRVAAGSGWTRTSRGSHRMTAAAVALRRSLTRRSSSARRSRSSSNALTANVQGVARLLKMADLNWTVPNSIGLSACPQNRHQVCQSICLLFHLCELTVLVLCSI